MPDINKLDNSSSLNGISTKTSYFVACQRFNEFDVKKDQML